MQEPAARRGIDLDQFGAPASASSEDDARACVIAPILGGAGYAVFHPRRSGAFLLPPAYSEGVERRVAPILAALSEARARPAKTRAPRGAPLAAFLSLAPCFRSGRGKALRLPRAGRLPPPLASRHVQPFKAAGLSAGGRLARASRGCACEARPRAPHLPHSENASRSAPHGQVN
jgi:hypothetical protein